MSGPSSEPVEVTSGSAERTHRGRVRSALPLRGLSALAAALTGVMLVVGNANLLWRWFTGQQIPGAMELVLVLLPMAVFAAAPLSERDGVNVRSTIVIDRLVGRSRRVVLTLGLLFAAATTALLTTATGAVARSAVERWEVVVGVRALPVWPTRVVIFLGFLGLFAVVVRELWSTVRDQRSEVHTDTATTAL